MDELQISGKRYLSSRRAAKDNGYASDYIGQLIRGGKLRGQKVGRAWYVEAETLESYLRGEDAAEASAEQAGSGEVLDNKIETPTPASAPLSSPEQVEAEPIKEIQAPIAIAVEEKPIPVAIEINKNEAVIPEIKEKQEEDESIIVKIRKEQRGLRYIENESLLPEIAPKAMTTVMPAKESRKEEEAVVIPRAPRSRVATAVLATVAVAAFVGSAIVGSSMAATLHIHQGLPASAGYSVSW